MPNTEATRKVGLEHQRYLYKRLEYEVNLEKHIVKIEDADINA